MTWIVASIFEQALGSGFSALHPRMQERLALDSGRGVVCIATGVMNRIWHGSRLLTPFLHLGAAERLLIPESGHDVPFVMENRPFRDRAGREGLAYTRTFDFGRRRRRFDSATVFDPGSGKLIDYLGTHRLVAAEWHVEVDPHGGLVIHGGDQRVGAGDHRFSVPASASAKASVWDWYDQDIERFRIHVRITNSRVGTIMGYEGVFTCRFK